MYFPKGENDLSHDMSNIIKKIFFFLRLGP